jgi:hypothetical protein
MTELIVRLNDNNMVNDLIHAIQLLRGVDGVSIRQNSELDLSIEEIKNHQVYSADNVDNLMEQLNS